MFAPFVPDLKDGVGDSRALLTSLLLRPVNLIQHRKLEVRKSAKALQIKRHLNVSLVTKVCGDRGPLAIRP